MELDIFLLWYKIPKSEWGDMKKKFEKWNEVKDRKPPFFALWTDEDENKLDKLKKKEIKFGNTALGRLVNVQKQEHEAAFCSSSHVEQINSKAVEQHP